MQDLPSVVETWLIIHWHQMIDFWKQTRNERETLLIVICNASGTMRLEEKDKRKIKKQKNIS